MGGIGLEMSGMAYESKLPSRERDTELQCHAILELITLREQVVL